MRLKTMNREAAMTSRCVAYALAGALVASSAHAYVGLPDEMRTYYEPGYFRELNDLDRIVLSRHRALPPVEYDHPYQGRLLVIDAGSMENVWRMCHLAVPHLTLPEVIIGCAVRSDIARLDPDADCVIFHAMESNTGRRIDSECHDAT
jgi:hypothetical protein